MEPILRLEEPLLAQLMLMLKVKKLSPDAVLPTVAHPGEDIGYDLYSSEDVTLAARERGRSSYWHRN